MNLFNFLLICAVAGRLKDKWIGYNHTQRIRRLVSLFISPNGERVAVAVGNLITILRKEDDYLEPFGIFLGIVFLLKIFSLTCNYFKNCQILFGPVIYFLKDRKMRFQLLNTDVQDYAYLFFCFFFSFLVCIHFISIFQLNFKNLHRCV